MVITDFRRLLRSLCENSEWNYAVLWKLMVHQEMILSWGDGYFDFEKPRSPEETQVENGTAEFPAVQIAANMMDLQYKVGAGIVGQAACSGSHCWVLRNDLFTNYGIPECPEEWWLQFSSGIETILLVPVLPHGVLQLGSLETVAEDSAFLSFIKNRFNLYNEDGGDDMMLDICMPFNSEQIEPVLHFQEALQLGFDYQDLSLHSACEADSGDAPSPSNVHSSINDLEVIDHGVADMSCMEEQQIFGRFSMDQQPWDLGYEMKNPFLGFSGDFDSQRALSPLSQWSLNNHLVDFHNPPALSSTTSALNLFDDMEKCWVTTEDHAESLLEAVVADKHSNNPSSDFLGFESHMSPSLLNPFFPWQRQNDYTAHDPSVVTEKGKISTSDLSASNSSESLDESAIHGSLLDWNNPKSFSGVEERKGACGNDDKSGPRGRQLIQAQGMETQLRPNSISFASVIPEKRRLGTLEFGAFSPSDSLNDTKAFNSIVERKKQQTRAQKTSNGVKRKADASANKRPRPRDRQLIQDRIKELRDLIPNGTTLQCSIDGLLEQTIKHMVHLKGVTEQANKLKRWEQQEVQAKGTKVGDFKQNMSHSLEHDFQLCPIVVEDLETPGHMVIEMPCGEASLFIEIAQAIRRLDLTILKGTTKDRANDTWASFIVEAKKGFQKLEIFWPLMQIWQRKRNTAPRKFPNPMAVT